MELEKLIKKRDAYAGKIVRMAIYIALIFIIPVGIALGVYFLFDIPLVYTFPVAFISSWIWVILVYKKVSKEARLLDAQIKELKDKESITTN